MDSTEEVVFHFHNFVFLSTGAFLFVVAANDMFANSLNCLSCQGTENPSVAARAEGRCGSAAVPLAPTCGGISCGN
jgi:hypothetical protein